MTGGSAGNVAEYRMEISMNANDTIGLVKHGNVEIMLAPACTIAHVFGKEVGEGLLTNDGWAGVVEGWELPITVEYYSEAWQVFGEN